MKKLGFALAAAVVIFMGMMLKPVPLPNEKDCLIAEGIASTIWEGPSNDILIQLNGDNTKYYINRGLEKGLSIDQLRSSLVGKKVTIKYPEYWSPLDYNDCLKHISKVLLNDQVIFSEIG